MGAACVGPGPRAAVDGARSVLGSPLEPCPSRLRTGFHRDGYCNTGPEDVGVHVVCAEVNEAFLRFTRERGNDLSTARGEFPGLAPGDAWCLCASRYQEAAEAGFAPNVYLASTDEAALRTISKATLDAHAAAGARREATTSSPRK